MDFSKETQNKVGGSVRAQSCQLSEEMSETLGDIEIEPRVSAAGLNINRMGIYCVCWTNLIPNSPRGRKVNEFPRFVHAKYNWQELLMSSMWLRMPVCDLINISYYKYGSHNLRSLTTHGSILLYISFIVY